MHRKYFVKSLGTTRICIKIAPLNSSFPNSLCTCNLHVKSCDILTKISASTCTLYIPGTYPLQVGYEPVCNAYDTLTRSKRQQRKHEDCQCSQYEQLSGDCRRAIRSMQTRRVNRDHRSEVLRQFCQ